MIEYRNKLIEYLCSAKELAQKDIDAHNLLPIDEKVKLGLAINDAELDKTGSIFITNESKFNFTENNSKIRVGDKVFLRSKESTKSPNNTFVVLEINNDYIIIDTKGVKLEDATLWIIEVNEVAMFDNYIESLKKIDIGLPGEYFIQQLALLEKPEKEPFFGVDDKALTKAETLSAKLNKAQLEAVKNSVKLPSIQLIQGPPGTGKTFVLACIADLLSSLGYEIGIVAKTHQAVNNALNAIKKKSSNANVFKIGQSFHSEGLDGSIIDYPSFEEYSVDRKNRKKAANNADIVGMTLHAATINLCIRNNSFKPRAILVDEASQIPLAEGASIGASGAGTIIFIGDDRQMPPIFVNNLEKSDLSISIFEHIAKNYPDSKVVLDTTYRMNKEICDVVNKRFYLPYGINLKPDSSIEDRKLDIEINSSNSIINSCFSPESNSIVELDVSNNDKSNDYNIQEAEFAANILFDALESGVNPKEIAVVTPFRKQVTCIRNAFKYIDDKNLYIDNMPLIDTVERLQGQDVDIIILSFSVTNPEYFKSMESFIINENRINVMISRAKKKVIILKSSLFKI